MAAELGTMRVTEQIDALSALGTNPIYYLVVPRFLACVLLIPLLTLMADFMGVIGGAAVSTQILNVDSFAYWKHTRDFVDSLDIFAGVFKSYFFGAAIALISCHRGFNSKAGAEGVGQAATEAFVFSFIAILFLDFVLGLTLEQRVPMPSGPRRKDCYEPGGCAEPKPDATRRDDLIEMRDVSMRFRHQSVLRDINLVIHRGETVCIIGESGCGKTVMLKLIIGLLHPTAGARRVRRPRRRHAQRQGAGQDAAPVRVPVPDGRALRQPDDLR